MIRHNYNQSYEIKKGKSNIFEKQRQKRSMISFTPKSPKGDLLIFSMFQVFSLNGNQ